MSRLQLPSSSGLRMDGRKPAECRRLSLKMGVLHRAVDGSAQFQIGQTIVLAAVSGPREADRWSDTRHDRAIVNVEFYASKFSGPERLKSSKGDSRSAIIEATIRRVFEPIILMQLFPRSEVSITVELIQNDGGVLPACINAITLALINAGVPIEDFACASSAGYIDSVPVLDLSYAERSVNGVETTVVVLPVSGKISLVEMESTLPADQFAMIMEAAVDGCHQMHRIMKKHIREHTFQTIQSDDTNRSTLLL
uniref:Uncharacterized protein n=1 Tax=Spongospora subterranea TaxID=70186 RepID=A0A0H5RQS1_9EUKA|eukprot:CRZ11069.1 hypothetical protein [Spongospora subterranea]